MFKVAKWLVFYSLNPPPPPPKKYQFKQMNIHFNVMLPEFTSNIKMTDYSFTFYFHVLFKIMFYI